MATVDRPRTDSTFTSEAMRMLDCFSSGFDEILSNIAESIAVSRTPKNTPVEISEKDIKDAAELIVRGVRESQLPPSVKAEVAAMMDCLATKAVRKK